MKSAGNHLFCNHDGAFAGLDLLHVVPARALDPGIALGIGNLHLDDSHIRLEGFQNQPLFTGEGILDEGDIGGSAFRDLAQQVGAFEGIGSA